MFGVYSPNLFLLSINYLREVTQDADVIVDTKHAPLLSPPVHRLQLRDSMHPYLTACA